MLEKNLEVISLCVGAVGTNCYLAASRETQEAAIIDPGDEADRIDQALIKHGYHPTAILLTHGHFDHVLAAKTLAERYGLEIYAHEIEKETLESPELNAGGMIGLHTAFSATRFVKEGDAIETAGFSFQVLLTPGHTPGGVCYYLRNEGALFSGDTLFAGSVGRTDFPRGSMRDLLTAIQTKLLPLPEETIVYPGHMETTTIGQEKRYNMYL